MKFFVLLLAMVAMASASGGKEKKMMKKWMIGKAMESCFGKENTKTWVVLMKKATAECANEDAPELELPMFGKPYRVVNGLLQGASSQSNNNGWMDNMMRNYFMEMVFKNSQQQQRSVEDQQQMNFFKKPSGMFQRFRRDHHDEEDHNALDLGDRLIDSLTMHKEHMKEEIGNCTCILRKCHVIDEDNNLDIEGMIKHMNEHFKLEPWLKEHIEKDKRMCYEYAESLPESVLNGCATGPKMVKIKYFKDCMKKSKIQTCMSYDMKQKLEENFGSIADIVQKTGLKENELYPLTFQLMHGNDRA